MRKNLSSPDVIRLISLNTLTALTVLLLSACGTHDGPQPSASTETPTPSTSNDLIDPLPPEIGTGFNSKDPVTATQYMAVTNNPYATQAAYDVLKQGGTAIDAAIAAQMVLNLTEPQSSGIGGGAMLMVYDKKTDTVSSYDGRETAPMAATEELFYGKDGKPMAFADAVIGGRSSGTPGVLRMLKLAHDAHGKTAWKDLFRPAIILSENGFNISPRMANSIAADAKLCKDDATAAAYFCNADGSPKAVGTLLKNPQLAQTFTDIANQGIDVFYNGKYAKDIVQKIKNHATNPGLLELSDFTSYQAKIRQPICTDYRQYKICGFPPPSSGGITVAQILGILETRDMSQYKPTSLDRNGGQPSVEGIHLFAEASRLAYADRNLYIADTDFVPLPGSSPASMLNKNYLAARASLIENNKSLGLAPAGKPAGAESWSPDDSPNPPSTTQLTIVDRYGNVVSMTTTIEGAFGSHQMVDGFLLNNQLTDFSITPKDAQGNKVANRVQPGKRPRSSMAPTIVFNKDSGEFAMATGSPGGATIIEYVAKTLVGTLDWGLNAQQTISLPNFGSTNGSNTFIEKERLANQTAAVTALQGRGHQIVLNDQTSGLAVIVKKEGVLVGGADPRREGVAMGD